MWEEIKAIQYPHLCVQSAESHPNSYLIIIIVPVYELIPVGICFTVLLPAPHGLG